MIDLTNNFEAKLTEQSKSNSSSASI